MKAAITKDSGFFIDTHSRFLNFLSEENIKCFAQLKSNFDCIKFVVDQGVKFPSFELRNVKDEVEALKLKEIGNKTFQKGDYKKAAEIYTDSIVKFPENGNKTELAIIRANRSAALYHLGHYELSLKDIDFAIKQQYPKNLMFKILDRKAMCLLALKQHNSALIALRETIQALDDAKLPLEKILRKQKDIEITTSVMLKKKLKDEKLKAEDKIKISKVNKIYKAASKSIDIKYDEKMGRYAEANCEIDVGEIILTENAHCAVLLPENKKTHCFQCFKRLLTAEPCPKCSNVKFCSEYCKDVALKTHHTIECKILETLWASGASITTFMALRIISQRNVQYFFDLKVKLDKKQETSNEVYDGSSYLTVRQLVKHEKQRSTKDLLHRAHMAVFLLSLLKDADYFIEMPDLELRDFEIFIGSLILEHLQSLQFNAHEISELIGQNENSSKNIFLGGGLYPTLALFNHSCEPSIIRYFNGTTVVARTIKSLKPGEMVAENYGPIFTQVPKEERRRILKSQYWFDCCCEPCVKNWPLLSEMDPEIMRFHCENKSCDNVIIVLSNSMEFMAQCRKCGQHTNILKGLKALQDSDMCFKLGQSLVNEGNIERGTKKYIELHHILTDVLVPPFKDYYICQQTLRYCFLACGNKSPDVLA